MYNCFLLELRTFWYFIHQNTALNVDSKMLFSDEYVTLIKIGFLSLQNCTTFKSLSVTTPHLNL